MARKEVLMPRMGESVMEGTILQWLKKPGDKLEEEEALIEIATDKVDTEIPAPFGGTLAELLVKEGDIVPIDTPIAIVITEGEAEVKEEKTVVETTAPTPTTEIAEDVAPLQALKKDAPANRFYSPLVLNIARKENISMDELEQVQGTGKDQRVTKKDILRYVEKKSSDFDTPPTALATTEASVQTPTYFPPIPTEPVAQAATTLGGDSEIIAMSRMRKIISERMLSSKAISAHVTSFVEADVTNVVFWRNRNKQNFKDKANTILTYTPIMVEAVAKAIKDYPMMNVSVQGDNIIKHNFINIGIAVALPDGNLVVPVIKNVDQLNLIGITKQVNDLAKRARAGKLRPDELEGGTFTISNVGSFGNLMGTPIIVQPQVGILAFGAIIKKPAVVETPLGDTIGIRHRMHLSHSYDHRVVDGSLGGMFVRRVADFLERYNVNREVF